MPAAAKIEKPASGEVPNGKDKIASSANNGVNYLSNLFQEPQKIVNTVIDKKVRNLEKRKARLLELKALEDKGQQLEAEQKIAVKKLHSVVEMIDMLKEIGKNVSDGLNEHAKQVKKQQKKEQMEKQSERQQQDVERVKFWLNSQLILSKYLPLETVKNDLSQGKIGEIKFEENKVTALEKLAELFAPSSFDSIEPSVEKINNLLDGNKRESISGVAYSDLKDLLVQFIESKHFESIPTVNESDISSTENESQVQEIVSSEPVQIDSEIKSNDQPNMKQSVQNVHPLNNQLCFMRDPEVVENELQLKDPAVVAVASLGFPYPPQNVQALSTSSGSNIQVNTSTNYPHIPYPAIPTQTFTNQGYGNFIIPHQMIPEQSIPVNSRNVAPDAVASPQGEKSTDLTEKSGQFPSENISKDPASQDADKPMTNGQFDNRGQFKRGRGRGYGIQNGNYRRGGNGGGNKGNFGGYYNNSNGNVQNFNNPNNRPPNRQNGTGPRGSFRGRVNPNHFNDQANPVSAK